MYISSKEEHYRTHQHSIRLCILTFLAIIVSLSIVLSVQTQRAMATGSSVVVTISGPTGQEVLSPALLTIHIYDTIIFVNQSTLPYAVAADDNSFSSPAILHNQQWSTTSGILGAHSYHASLPTSNTTGATAATATIGATSTTIMGEILVVADNIALLPTPQPQIEATALAIIESGKHPPDVIQLPVATMPVTGHHVPTIKSLQTQLLSLPVLAGAGGMLIMIIVLIIVLSRRKRRTKHDDDDFMDDDLFSTTHTYQTASSMSSATTAMLVAQETQVTKTTPATQTRKIVWPLRLLQGIKTRLKRHKAESEDDENEGDEEYEHEA